MRAARFGDVFVGFHHLLAARGQTLGGAFGSVGYFVDAGVGLICQAFGGWWDFLSDLVDGGVSVGTQVLADLGNAVAVAVDFAVDGIVHGDPLVE